MDSGTSTARYDFDRYVRDDAQLLAVVRYIPDNPVCAGLCANRSSWPWSFVRPELEARIPSDGSHEATRG